MLMAACVQERAYIQNTLFYQVDFLIPAFTIKLQAASKITLKEVTLYWLYALLELGPKD